MKNAIDTKDSTRRTGTDNARDTDTIAHPTGDQQVLERIATTELPPQIKSLVETYEQLVGVRNPFLWKWLYVSVQETRLSCVPREEQETVDRLKVLVCMYNVVVDDIADHICDARHVEIAAQIPSSYTDPSELNGSTGESEVTAHLEFAQLVWDEFEQELRDAPRADEFWSLLEFDVDSMLLAMKHSVVARHNREMKNCVEELSYQSQSLCHYVQADIDLMYSPDFDRADLGQLRHIIWTGQQLHRLTNWVSTWERELPEGDVSSGVFTLALERGVFDADDLERVRDGTADLEWIWERVQTNNLEQRLIDRWEQKYTAALTTAFETEAESVDLVEYIVGVRRVCQNAMAKRGEMG